jgi:DNA helicase II / ATP-dependent DNA helicase PcrA
MTGMVEGVFPHARSMESDTEMEEERRLCYVGMTRSKEELNLTLASRRSSRGQAQFNPPSRFLGHLNSTGVVSLGDSVVPAVSRERPGMVRMPDLTTRTPERHAVDDVYEPPFSVGQRVRHGKFGNGVVVACARVGEDSEVTVAFPGIVGIKKLLQSFAKLESL